MLKNANYTIHEFKASKRSDKLPHFCLHCKDIFFRSKKSIQLALNLNSNSTLECCNQKCASILHERTFEVICKNCSAKFLKVRSEFIKSKNHFCSRSCAVSFNNLRENSPKRLSDDVYSSYKEQCRFKFDVYKYPNMFDLEQLDLQGWFTTSNSKRRLKNLDGMSRDHILSISEAFENGYDPYYISHICNCQLISQRENSIKNHKSSISYLELIHNVNQYDHYHQ